MASFVSDFEEENGYDSDGFSNNSMESMQENDLEEQTTCPLWKMLSGLESPFNWLPDIQVLNIPDSRIQEDLIQYLTDKEKKFSRAKTNILREVVVYLVLAYEKACEDQLIEALEDVAHCYSLLGNPRFFPTGMQVDNDIDVTVAKGDELYAKLKERRAEAKGRALTKQPPIDAERLFLGFDINLPKGKQYNEDKNRSAQGLRDMSLSKLQHLLTSSGCTFCSDLPKEMYPNNKPAENTMKPATLISEDQHLADTGKARSEGKQPSISANTADQPSSHAFYDLLSNATEKDLVIESKKQSCPPGIKSQETDCNNSHHKPANEGSKCDSNDICNKICSSHVVTHLDSNGIPDYALKVPDKYDESQESERIDSCPPGIKNQETDCDNSHHKPANEGSKCDSNDIRDKIYSSRVVTHPDSNGISDYVLKVPDKYDELQESEIAPVADEERKAVLLYAVNAVVAHIAYFCENYQQSYMAAQVCKYQYSQLGKTGMATLLAVKGSVFLEYGLMGNKLALPFLKEALSLDPDYWEWNLLCGKVIGRLQRFSKGCDSAPEQEEIQLLEKAAQLNPNDASCLVHLANVYRSISHFQHISRIEAEAKSNGSSQLSRQAQSFTTRTRSSAKDYFQKWRNPQNIPISHASKLNQQQKDYLELAHKLYLKALEVEQHCPYNNARCAKGLWSMPHPYRDKQRALEAIIHAQTMAPSDSLVNHYAGMFYEFVGDKQNALECYKRATSDGHFNYPAEMSYINLKLKMMPSGTTTLLYLDHLLYKYTSPHFVLLTLCFKGHYLYMVEKKILLAIRDITTAIIIDPKHPSLKTFRPGSSFGRNIPAINMYELLKEMLENYQQSPQSNCNGSYWDKLLEFATRLINEHCDKEAEDNVAGFVHT